MMSPSVIRAIADNQAAVAAANNRKPFVYWDATEVTERTDFPFPFLGDYVPEGWEYVRDHFVDSSGFGQPGEPALTADQFRRLIQETIANVEGTTGWAITQAGQFQVYVGEYRKTNKPSGRPVTKNAGTVRVAQVGSAAMNAAAKGEAGVIYRSKASGGKWQGRAQWLETFGQLTVMHWSTVMLSCTFDATPDGTPSIHPGSVELDEGYGSVSDQQGMNQILRDLGLDWRYDRDERGGGPRYTDLAIEREARAQVQAELAALKAERGEQSRLEV